jgi:phosphate transport system substrate-binding protein
MKTRRFIVLVLILSMLGLTLSSCQSANSGQGSNSTRSGTITLSGAWALYPLVIRWSEEYQALYPDVRFDISAGGAGKGMADVLANAVDIGMVSREIYPQETDQGAVGFAVAKDAVFLTVNTSNPVWNELSSRGVTRDQLIDLYITGQITSWNRLIGQEGEDLPIHLFTRSDACGAAETWANYLGSKQEDLLGIGVYGDPGVLESVMNDPLGLGFNNLNYAFDSQTGFPIEGIRVVPLDVNSNQIVEPEEILDSKVMALSAVGAGIYPSPPARDLYLVTRGLPQGLVRDFIFWVITDGQVYLGEAGYIPIPQDDLQAEIQELGS